MTHPDLTVLVEALEERVVEVNCREIRATIFATSCRLHFASKSVAHKLRTIANAQNRHASPELVQVNAERFRIIDAVRTACQNDADNIRVRYWELVVRQYLAEGVELAQTACNQLSGLRTEVQDDDFLLLHII